MARNREAETEGNVTPDVTVAPEENVTQEVTKTTAESVTPKVTATAAGADIFVYVGPNVLPLSLKRFQVFRGGLPAYVTRAIEKIPEVRDLIVPVAELENMRQKIDKPGTNEARLFDAVQRAARDVK